MTIKFTERDFFKFYNGTGMVSCHVDAPHAASPQADLYTDEIVKRIISKANCSGIISTISRTIADLNRKPDGQNDLALEQYRKTIQEFLHHLGIFDDKKNRITKPYLHLSIHGMKDVHHGPYAIEVGTFNGNSCSNEVKKWFGGILLSKSKEIMPRINIIFDEIFDGDESIVFHRLGDGESYTGYGENFHTFQIEIARTLRKDYLTEIVELLSCIILDFQRSFGKWR